MLSIYKPSGEYPSVIFDRKTRRISSRWASLLKRHPWRFLAALDIAPDRMEGIAQAARSSRDIVEDFPLEVQKIILYKAAWRLMFHEEIADDGID